MVASRYRRWGAPPDQALATHLGQHTEGWQRKSRRVESANRAPASYPSPITATGLTGETVAPTNFKGAQTKSKRWCPLELRQQRAADRSAVQVGPL